MVRSVHIHDFGGPEALRIEDVDVGEPGDGEVRLRIHAIGLNRTEITLRSGRSPGPPNLASPTGFEAAGVVEALGLGMSNAKVGDRVALAPAYGASQHALYGEASRAPARSLVAIPQGVDFATAADTWSAFGTAWTGLVWVGALEAGQTILISAASSSIEHGAAEVVATAELDVVAEVNRLTDGAGADLVFDPVGGPGFRDLAQATALGGLLVIYGALATAPTVVPPFDIFARDLTVRGAALTSVTRYDAALAEMNRFVTAGLADGGLRPVIDRTFPFDSIVEAHRYLEAGSQVGKVVVTV